MLRLFRHLLALRGKKRPIWNADRLFKRNVPDFGREIEFLEVRRMLSVTLGPGDIAFTGLQTDDPDTFSFVLLKTVDSSTALTFTDNGWASTQTGFANSTENTLTVTFNSNYSAGTQFVFQNGATPAFQTVVGGTSAGSTTGTLSGLSTSGDSILAYQGTAPTTGSATNWIAGINSNGGWQTNPSNSNESDLPSALANGTTAIAFSSSKDNGALNLSSVTGTVAQIRAQVNDITKWTLSDTSGGAATVPPTVTFTISGNNNAPTGLSLSSTSIAENNTVNATVGTFTTTDPDSGNTFTYSLVSGTGSTDNGSFNINSNALRATSSFDYETKNSYSIRVRTTDQGGLTFDQIFTITVTDVTETTTVLLNEIKANPPGNTAAGDKYQYVELRGAAGAVLTNIYVVMLDGNGSNVGLANYVIGLTGSSLGSNGLLMIKSPTAGHSAAAGTTVVTDSKFDSVSGGVLSKNTVSFYVVSATSAVVEGTDYDTNDDGVLDHLPAGFTVLDNVGWSDGDSGDVVYGGVSLTQNQGTPDAATRFTNDNLTETAAWFNGDLYDVANDPSQLLYDATRHSTNLPLSPNVATLTPGAVNFTEPPVITTNSGLTVTAGTAANVVADTKLKTTDAEQTAAQLTFTITVLPASGTLKFNNAAVVANVTTFTQADITANKLTYDAPASSGTASFSFSVSDGTQATTGTFALMIQASTDTTLRIVDYNIASSGGTGDPRTGFDTLLQAFSQESYNGVIAQVDLFIFQEVKSQATTSQFIVDELNGVYGTGVYNRGTLDGYTSGAGTQGVVYNTHTLQLVSEATVGVSGGTSRQTMRYLFHPIGGTATSDFYVYDSHLKASQGSSESAQRLEEAQAIRADADALGQGVNIIYAGDFNLYTSTEDAYQEYLSTGNGQAFDPLNRPGSWHNNSSFVGIDTQAPAVSPPSGLTSGGLDDRFDFQLITGELTDGQGLEYLTGSYHTFGNNGSVGLNQSINDAGSTALPGLANRTTVLDLLTTVTDHLPVVADYTFTVSATNTAPTAVSFSNTTTSIAENTAVGTNLKVADITVTDDGFGTNSLSLSGVDQSFFTIIGTSLYLKAGTSLNFESKSSFAVTVNVDDTTVGSTPDASANFTLTVTNVNEAPTAVGFTNTTTSLAENTTVPTDLKVADINVTDDAWGTNTLSLSGADQSFFTIIGTTLYLKTGTSLNFETKASYSVTVNVDDTTVGSTPDASTSFTLTVTNVNEAPTAVGFTNTTTNLAENTTIGVDLKMADINVTDDALGTNALSLSGADQAFFKIVGSGLYLKAGTSLNFETKSSYAVTVNVDDTTVGTTPDASTNFTLALTDLNDNAPVITTSAAQSVAEGVTQVAVLASTDADTVGTNPATFSITGGADMSLFHISGSNLLFISAKDYENDSHQYVVAVTAFDGVNSTSRTVTVTLTDVNDNAPVITISASQSVAEGMTQVALLTSTDADTVGDNPATFTITGGADMSLFGIDGGNLVFNTPRDFETDAHSYAVEVTAFDGLNSTPLIINVILTDVDETINLAPTAVGFNNATTSLPENTALGADLKVATIDVTDDGVGTNLLSLTGIDQAAFKIIGSSLYLKAGTSLNFETKASYAITVSVDDTAVGGTPDASTTFTLNVTDVNEAPTISSFTITTTTLAENTAISTDLKVADISITDDSLGTNTLFLSGTDQIFFKLIGTSLYLKADTSLDFETHAAYFVTVNVDDTSVGSTPDASASFTLNVTDLNEPPIAVSFINSTTNILENTAVPTDLKVADIIVIDDAQGTNTVVLGGADLNFFKIIGSSLYLKSGTGLNFETKSSYAVTVNVDDATVGGSPDALATFTLNVTDVNEAPTLIALINTTTSLVENTAIPTDLKVADITVADDALGTNTLSLSGADQAAFKVIGTGLYLRAGTSLDFEAKASYAITVSVDDTTVGSTPDASASFTLSLTNANDAPSAIAFANTTTSIVENTAVPGDLKLADINVTDDNLGTNTLSLSGADQGVFKLIGTGLYLKAGASLDFETKSSYVVTVNVDDTTIGSAPDASANFTLNVTNANEAPTVVAFVNPTTSLAENTAIPTNLKLADILVTDDALGTNTLSLSGADQNFFTIIGTSLYLKSGTSLNFEAKSSYAVTVNVDDATVDSTPDASAGFTLTVTNVNEAPTAVAYTNTTTSLAENTAIGSDLKVADINIPDDALGINSLSLSGADQAVFKIIGTGLFLKAGINLDFETKSSYAVIVNADDLTVGSTPDAATGFTLNVTNLNEAPTAVAFANSITNVVENTAVPTNLKVADINVTDDVLGANTLSLSGADQVFFTLIGSGLYLKAGTSLNFEAQASYIVTVNVDDITIGGSPDASASFTLNVSNLNDAPTAVALVNTTTSVVENIPVNADLQVADINLTDDALGTNTLSLSGADQNFFRIIGNGLFLKAGTSLDFETKASYIVTVNADDTSAGGTPDATASFTLNVTDLNEAPTAVYFTNTTTSLTENTVVNVNLKVADINITDDALGANTLSLSGADQAAFQIIGSGLYLKAGINLDFETKSSYSVTVNLDDAAVGSTPDASASFTLTASNVNETPTAVTFSNTTNAIAENTSIGVDLKVADINVTDDALGSNNLSLGGADQAAFKIIGSSLYLRAGASRDFETKPAYSVTVNVDDTTVGNTPDASANFTLSITNLDEAPTAVSFTNTTNSVAENSALGVDLKVADITVTDDALGANTLSLSGADQAAFKIIGTSLYLKAGTSLDFETKSTYAVTVNVDDAAVGNSPDASANFTVSVTNVNEAPTAIELTNTTGSIAENSSTTSHLKVADINISDDALGANKLSLSGIDQTAFEIVGTSLYLKAGTNLDFETKASYAVTVNVDDTTIGGTPDAFISFTLNVTDINEASTTVTLANTTTSLAENTLIGGDLKVADINVADDALGINNLSLNGADQSAFAIIGSGLYLKSGTSLNFETKSFYSVTVNADDTTIGNTPDASAIFTLTVTNLNEAPTISVGQTFFINENSAPNTAVGTVIGSDPDTGQSSTLTFDKTGNGTGVALFNVAANGQITVAPGAILNFEATPTYTLEVQATDSGSPALHSAAVLVTIHVNDLPEAPQLVLGGPAVTWIKKQPPITVLPLLTVSESSNLAGGALTIQMQAKGTRKKSLDQLTTPGTGTLGTSTGIQYANGRLTLHIDLGPSVTTTEVQSFLRGLKFSTKGGGLRVLTRAVIVTLADANGLFSSVEQTINIRKKE